MSRPTMPGLHVDLGGATELAFKLAVAGNTENTHASPTRLWRNRSAAHALSRCRRSGETGAYSRVFQSPESGQQAALDYPERLYQPCGAMLMETTNTIRISIFLAEYWMPSSFKQATDAYARAKYKWLSKLNLLG